MLVDLPILGWTNPHHVVRVLPIRPRWAYADERYVARSHVLWGKPIRHNGWWAHFHKPAVSVHLLGKLEPLQIECETWGQAMRDAKTIIEAVNEACEDNKLRSGW